MKRKIVICCEKMLTAMSAGDVIYDGKMQITGAKGPDFGFCPWCGDRLPFPYYEEEKP
jgi:hypothetical protein